jgi:hypothetical protein
LRPPATVLILVVTATTISLLGLLFSKATRHLATAILGGLRGALVFASTIGLLLTSITRRFLLAAIARGFLLAGSVAGGFGLLVSALFTVAALRAAGLALSPAVLLAAVPRAVAGFGPLVLATRTCTTPVSIVGVWVTITTTVFLVLLSFLFLTLLTLLLCALLVRVLAIVRVVIVIVGVFLVWLTAASIFC